MWLHKSCIVLIVGTILQVVTCAATTNDFSSSCPIPSMRPSKNERKFTSSTINNLINQLKPKFKDPNLAQLFENCLPNTLDTTVFKYDGTSNPPDTFIITGDITAMWLRDSANQVAPYVPYASTDASLANMLRGVLSRQVRSVLIDAYANAFQLEGSGPSPHNNDRTSVPSYAGTRVSAMTLPIFERKYELDSISNVLKLSADYYQATHDKTPFDTYWVKAVSVILNTMIIQQRGTLEDLNAPNGPAYNFQRQTAQALDTLQNGAGNPGNRTGLIKTAFRPSDDAHLLPFNIPQNAFAVVALRGVAKILSAVQQTSLASTAIDLANQVDAAIQTYGIIHHPFAGHIYAYEVDGYGNNYFMDDANLPSLLSLPYIGYVNSSDSIYLNTRRAILSKYNPWYFAGSAGEGVGGPHVGMGMIWPMSIITRAITSNDDQEITHCLDMLISASACTGLMHESFSRNSVYSYTRAWFAWANSYFGQLVLYLAQTKPNLIFNYQYRSTLYELDRTNLSVAGLRH